MASIIIAATYLTYSKIRDKRDQRKEKKRAGYEERYAHLQREREWEKGLGGERDEVGSMLTPPPGGKGAESGTGLGEEERRRSLEEGRRSEEHRERQNGGTGSGEGGRGWQKEDEKRQTLI